MSSFQLRPARRGEIFTRALFFGESGQGKTMSGLEVAFHLAALYGYQPHEIAVIDTEPVEPDHRQSGEVTGSAEKYEGRPCNCNRCHREGLVLSGFQTMIMEPGARGPDEFMRALEVCRKSGIKIVLLDGITDEWRAVLQLVDAIKTKSGKKDDGWSTARPKHSQFERACMEYPGHLIATCRAKRESQHKKADPGMGDVLPDQDSNVIYLYDVAVFFKRGHGYVVKSRDDRLEGANSHHPGADLAEGLKRWCDDPRAAQKSAATQFTQWEQDKKDHAGKLPQVAPNTRTDVTPDPTPRSGATSTESPGEVSHDDLLRQVDQRVHELREVGRSDVANMSLEHARKHAGHRTALEKLLVRQDEVIAEARAKLAAVGTDQAEAEEGFEAPF